MVGEDVSRCIMSVVEGVTQGVPPGFGLRGSVKFEISVAKIKQAGGDFRLEVVELGGKYRSEEVSKVTFAVAKEAVTSFVQGRRIAHFKRNRHLIKDRTKRLG